MTLCLYTGKQCECQPQEGVACPHIPRFDIELGGYGRDSIAHISKPDGEWVRWREVERVILDPLKRCPAWTPPTDCDGEQVTPQRLIAWLDAKFTRHGEEEDKWAADYIRATAGVGLPAGAKNG